MQPSPRLPKLPPLRNEKYKDMLLKIDAKNRSVNFRGTRAQIKDANIILKDILDRIIVSTMPADDALIKLVLFKEIDIVTWLKEKVNIISVGYLVYPNKSFWTPLPLM